MSRVFDYNGVTISKSTPVQKLRTVKKTLLIDSADRDTTKYYTNGDFVVYLPRVYENITSLRLMAGEFPPLAQVSATGPCGYQHFYAASTNYAYTYNPTGPTGASDVSLTPTSSTGPFNYYFLVDIEGLNKTDETTVGASKSTFPDGFFAKIPALATNYGTVNFIEYNDHSGQDNIAKYTPPIGKLDRLHVRTRLHSQQGNQGFIYWTTDGKSAVGPTGTNQKGAEYSLTLEIEYLDNVFDDFSGFESRITERSS